MSHKTPKLLTRDQFREGTLKRDRHKCVFCGRGLADGVKLDAHHIMERRLWWSEEQFGGYYLENGATCCDTGFDKTQKPVSVKGRPLLDYSCHLLCGMTILSPQDCRHAAFIDPIWLPNHLYPDVPYTLWGDTILRDGRRTRGELFQDESVQTMLKLGDVLGLYTKYIRHHRTLQLPNSPIVEAIKKDAERAKKWDDLVMPHTTEMDGMEYVYLAKMDGGQVNMYDDYMHLRSLDFKADPTTSRLQALHDKLKHNLKGLRLNVENLIGSVVTGIQYRHLKSFWYLFGIWDNDSNTCLSWNETVEYGRMIDDIVKNECGESMGLPLVDVLYRGEFSQESVAKAFRPTLNGDPLEGIVVRPADRYHYSRTGRVVGKYVRANHTIRHGGPYLPNYLEGTAPE